MEICICDDDIFIHEQIRSLIKSFSKTQFNIIDTFSGEELLEYYSNNNRLDIIFLDIEMNQMNGIKAADRIRQTDPNTIIIFVSSHSNYVFDTFRLEALHFIVKPINTLEFNNVFQRAIKKYNTTNSKISLKFRNERYMIIISDITYVEGYNRHITVHTMNEEYEAMGKIPEIIKVLEPHGFIRIHQGFIVNMDYIKRFDLNNVVLRDGTNVMISVRKRTEAIKAFDEYVRKWKW